MERRGPSTDQETDGADSHFTKDGVVGAGGSFSGARRDFVRE